MSQDTPSHTPDHDQQSLIIENVLATRYASPEMRAIFAPDSKIIHERDLWVAVMQAQASLGMDIPSAAIAAYEGVKNSVNLDSINARERVLLHDEKAKLEEFNALAGYEYAHLGLTSRDISDNVEQMEIREGLGLIRDRSVATLARLAKKALEHSDLIFAERTHNAIAQPSLVGKLFSDPGEELLVGFEKLENLIARYPLRGIKGAVGTQTDMLQLLSDQQKVYVLEQMVAKHLGFEHVLGSVGQIYPRSLDFDVITCLYQLSAGPANLSNTMRLMSGQQEVTEGFKEGQVGSTAMPYKMNMRTSERIHAFRSILMGHVTMASAITGDQWYAGDVSDSATRRIALPDSFYALDGLFQSELTVLDECGVYPNVLKAEFDRYFPFLVGTRILMQAVQNGVGRETAHKVIREHSVAVALRMRQEGTTENDLFNRLAGDPRLGLSKQDIDAAVSNPLEYVGNAPRQITQFADRVKAIVERYPEAEAYDPAPIL